MTLKESDAEYWMRRWNEAIAERDEAVRLLREVKDYCERQHVSLMAPLDDAIDAYLAKYKP